MQNIFIIVYMTTIIFQAVTSMFYILKHLKKKYIDKIREHNLEELQVTMFRHYVVVVVYFESCSLLFNSNIFNIVENKKEEKESAKRKIHTLSQNQPN